VRLPVLAEYAEFQSTPLPTGRSDSRPERLLLTTTFQSTPLPTGRSDGQTFTTPPPSSSFNPRPSQPEGATAGLLSLLRIGVCAW